MAIFVYCWNTDWLNRLSVSFRQATTAHLSGNWYFKAWAAAKGIIWVHSLSLIHSFCLLPFYKWFMCKSTSGKREGKIQHNHWDWKLILGSEIQVGVGGRSLIWKFPAEQHSLRGSDWPLSRCLWGIPLAKQDGRSNCHNCWAHEAEQIWHL